MPFIVLLLVAFAVGLAVYPRRRGGIRRRPARRRRASEAAGTQLGEEAVRHPWLARLLRGRLDPGDGNRARPDRSPSRSRSCGGILLGVLAYLMRIERHASIELDASVGQWGADHATSLVDAAAPARHRPREHAR